MLNWHESLAKHLPDFRARAEPPAGGEYGRTLKTFAPLSPKVPTPLRRVGMLVNQLSDREHLRAHAACVLQMTKRIGPSEAQQAAAKKGREAAAEALKLRNEAPAFDPPPASVTGSSSSTLCSPSH